MHGTQPDVASNSPRRPSPHNLPGAGYLPSGDIVKEKLAEAGATTDQIDIVLWLLNYGRSQKIASVSALAKKLNVHSSTVGRLFSGKYGADITSIIEKIVHFRGVQAERLQFGDAPVVTSLRVVNDITAFCDLARVSATVAILFGPNQSGKTWTLRNIYQPANNHGRTVYVRMPVGGGLKLFLEVLLKACGITTRLGYHDMKARAIRYFDPQTLLIVDEFHQTMIGRGLKTVTIDFIREIHDLSGCGVVLCGTDVVNDMIDDPKFRKFLGQIGNRGVLRRLIPATPYREDVTALCQAYGFGVPAGEAKKLVDQIASTNGIGKLCKYMQMSRRLANKRQVPVMWDHFLETHATLKSWEKGEQMKR